MFHQLFLLSARLIELAPRLQLTKLGDWTRIALGSMLAFGTSSAAIGLLGEACLGLKARNGYLAP